MRAFLAMLMLLSAGARAGLVATDIHALPLSAVSGDSITVTLSIQNNDSVQTVNSIIPQVGAIITGSVFLSLSGGPLPATQNLAPLASGSFTYVFSGVGCGDITFTGSASGSDLSGPVVSNTANASLAVSMVCYVTPTPAPVQGDAKIPGNVFHPLKGQPLLLDYSLPFAGRIEISVYDRNGLRVWSISRDRDAGSWSESWDGVSNAGALAASGVYVAHFQSKGLNKNVKLVIVK